MNKIKTTILLSLLLVGAFTPFMAARASTGYILIETDTPPTPAPVDVAAGANVSLNFGQVTFSGGQFYLVWSRDGFSQISSGDFKYSPTFTTAELHGTPTISNGVWIGNDWVNMSIPKNIGGGHYYVKCFDGSATSVAVTDNYINVLPSFEVVPDWGPGGTSITLKGYAFTSSGKVNLSYWDPIEGEYVTIQNLLSANALGQFNYSMKAPDMKQVLTPADEQPIDYEIITFRAIDNKTGYGSLGELDFDFTEYDRGLLQAGDQLADFESGYLYGNATDFTGIIQLGVGEDLIIAGQYFYPGNVTIWWDGTSQIGTALTNSSGFFNKTVQVPITTIGSHNVVLKDKNVKFVFTIEVMPTLILEPKEGPIGTVVTVKAYGFEADTDYFIYWYEKEYGDDTWYWLANATTGSNGQFKTTVKFTVFHTYGGEHDVSATDTYEGEEASSISEYATAVFTVTLRLRIVPSTFANDGKLVTVYGDGFDPTLGYTPNIDNNYLGVDHQNWDYPSSVYANGTGDVELKFVAAGFAPGIHVFSIYAGGELEPFFVLFTVTGPSPDTQLILNQITTSANELKASLAALSSSVSSLSSKVDALNAALTKGVQDIRSDVAGVKSDVSALSGAVSSGFSGVNGKIDSLSSSLSGKVDGVGSSLSSKIDNLGTTLSGKISDSANSIQSSISSSKDAISKDVKSSVGDLSTWLIIIGILAAITLVVELAILIRRLS